MAKMTELSALALDYLLGDRSVFANDEELSAVVQQLSDQLRPKWPARAIPDGTIVTAIRSDIAGERHEITGYDTETGLYTARFIPSLLPVNPRLPGLERQLYPHEFRTSLPAETKES